MTEYIYKIEVGKESDSEKKESKQINERKECEEKK